MGWFDKYLVRSQARKQDNMSYNQVMPYLQALNLETTKATDSIQGAMRLNGAPGLATEELRQKMRSGQQSSAQGLFQAERDRVSAENRNIDEGIINAKAKHEREKEERKNGLVKTLLQVGGAAVGSIVPGVGTAIGAGFGQIASGFVGGGGKIALDQANPEEIIAGVTDVASGISAASTLKTQKKDIGALTTYLQTNIGSTDPAVQQNLKVLSMAIDSGNMELVRKLIGGVQ